jgi:hypothetical protein
VPDTVSEHGIRTNQATFITPTFFATAVEFLQEKHFKVEVRI